MARRRARREREPSAHRPLGRPRGRSQARPTPHAFCAVSRCGPVLDRHSKAGRPSAPPSFEREGGKNAPIPPAAPFRPRPRGLRGTHDLKIRRGRRSDDVIIIPWRRKRIKRTAGTTSGPPAPASPERGPIGFRQTAKGERSPKQPRTRATQPPPHKPWAEVDALQHQGDGVGAEVGSVGPSTQKALASPPPAAASPLSFRPPREHPRARPPGGRHAPATRPASRGGHGLPSRPSPPSQSPTYGSSF